MNEFGVTSQGFRVKGFITVLEEKVERARQVFGDDVDLRSTSALRKILDLAALEDHELWKGMERLYFGSFLSTASGEALDLLGEDLGVVRPFLAARGRTSLTLGNAAAGRVYSVPLGTVLETDPPVVRFRTLAHASLEGDGATAEVSVEALERGPNGNVDAARINAIEPSFAARLRLGEAELAVDNAEPTAGGDQLEDDETYRDALLARPRTLWTLEAVRAAVKGVDGVRDCRLLDTAGGVDVSRSRFNLFAFEQRPFGRRRRLGSPYRFEVLVAVVPGHPWSDEGEVVGVRQRVAAAIEPVRPISIFPEILRADHVQIGLRSRVLVASGHDRDAVRAAILERLERRINALGLGRSVRFAEVMADIMAVAGVRDATELRLRRCPPRHDRISFGRSGRFQSAVVELAVGENLALGSGEIAELAEPSLIEIEVTDR